MPDISLANKTHTQISNDYRLIMLETTKIEEHTGNSFESIPKFNIIPFKALHLPGDIVPRFKYVDIRCEVITMSPMLEDIPVSYNGKTYHGKMHLEVQDELMTKMPLFLWGENGQKAKRLGLKYGDKITCQNVTVSKNDVLGKLALQCGINSKLYLD